MKRYRGRHLFVFLDNCSIHTSKRVQRFWADHKEQLTPIWNAPYTPELNLIERYWGHLKAKAIHNDYFGDEASLRAAIRQAVAAFNRSHVLRLRLESAHSIRPAA